MTMPFDQLRIWRQLTLLTSIFVSTLVAVSPTFAQQPPNILFLLTDDQRVDMVGHITPMLQTPTMDQLAKEGVRFRNAFVTTSICAASRASIFTGLVERTHGYTFGTPPLAERFIADSYPFLLREAGYRTGFVGKFGVRVPKGATQKMFDSFVPLRPAPYLKPQPDGTTRHLTDITADRAIEFVRDRSSDQPFCLSVSFNAPHAEDGDKRQYIWPDAMSDLYVDDIIPPAPLSSAAFFETQPQFLKQSLNRVRWKWRFDTPEKYQRMVKGYYRMISGVDAAIARIIHELEQQGLAANTIIILTSDNGYFLNERGFAGKWLPYDISLRVPLIVYDPRATAESEVDIIDEIALNIDVAATILDYAGLQSPQHMQGQSLLPLLSGQTPATWRTDFFCEHLMNHAQIPKHEGVRNQRYRYSRYFEQNPVVEELYDLQDDPQEVRNLIEDENYADILKMMRARCDKLRAIYQTASERGAD